MKIAKIAATLSLLTIPFSLAAIADTQVPVTCTWEYTGGVYPGGWTSVKVCHVGSDVALVESTSSNNQSYPPPQCHIVLANSNYGYTGTTCGTESVYKIIKN